MKSTTLRVVTMCLISSCAHAIFVSNTAQHAWRSPNEARRGEASDASATAHRAHVREQVHRMAHRDIAIGIFCRRGFGFRRKVGVAALAADLRERAPRRQRAARRGLPRHPRPISRSAPQAQQTHARRKDPSHGTRDARHKRRPFHAARSSSQDALREGVRLPAALRR